MTIVFAENFANDDSVSIVKRYPGSSQLFHPSITPVRAWPMVWSNNIPSPLTTTYVPKGNRIEIVLTCSYIATFTDAATSGWDIFGVQLILSGSRITINGSAMSEISSLRTATKIHIILEKV